MIESNNIEKQPKTNDDPFHFMIASVLTRIGPRERFFLQMLQLIFRDAFIFDVFQQNCDSQLQNLRNKQ